MDIFYPTAQGTQGTQAAPFADAVRKAINTFFGNFLLIIKLSILY